MTEANETLQAEVERLRGENQRLRDELDRQRVDNDRLRAELYRTGRYLREPPPRAGDSADEAEVGWAYQRGDLDDDLGDD